MQLTPTAETLLARRYLLPGETPAGLFFRVAHAVDTRREDAFRRMMEDLIFLPNTPTLMNAGTSVGQLSACFVLPVPDSIDGIFTALAQMAQIHKSGGGTGFSFSRIRPEGDVVSGTGGVASGPVSFMQVFDRATDAVKQGGRRRGANMGVLAASHPDIMSFIRSKHGGGLRNFNISIGFDGEYFRALEGGKPFPLVNPRDGSVWGSVDPRDFWEQVAGEAWATGDPGMLFFDEINRRNPTPGLGPLEATNPCGEQPLYPYESCNLGSVNLAGCIRKDDLDEALLRETCRTAVEFLDGVIDVNRFPIPDITTRTLLTRKIGLGMMGLADALILLGIPYESGESLTFAGRVMAIIQEEGHARSAELGEEKGSFPAIDRSIYRGAMRNATVTTVAPTGSLHLIAGTSSGIEPHFALSYVRKMAGTEIEVTSPLFLQAISANPHGTDFMDRVRKTGSAQELPIPDHLKELFRIAPEISPEFHVRMQAEVQKHVDNAVSKTVNLPEEAAPGDIQRIYTLARSLGCKGITVYRYGSKPEQVLSHGCDVCKVDD
ncbi:MAG: adenosylcobalamin-dependent ribonucleoside-diphosphate reductase [Methanomicrobiales archaeon]|nr:adenosylcobalamin-dependent ribonucleoside-diphosphate reductase [Methanomicrobiales archaeon]MDD1655303.1 adenosylcobalamin-dependent ribonucleoside-diphosphate reductase [Methanomicrobiales archaeon]